MGMISSASLKFYLSVWGRPCIIFNHVGIATAHMNTRSVHEKRFIWQKCVALLARIS